MAVPGCGGGCSSSSSFSFYSSGPLVHTSKLSCPVSQLPSPSLTFFSLFLLKEFQVWDKAAGRIQGTFTLSSQDSAPTSAEIRVHGYPLSAIIPGPTST